MKRDLLEFPPAPNSDLIFFFTVALLLSKNFITDNLKNVPNLVGGEVPLARVLEI